MNQEMHPAIRVIAVIILVFLLILGAWGLVVIFSWLPGAFSGFHLGSAGTPAPSELATTTPSETLAVSVSGPLQSGRALELSWIHQGGTGAYGYTISYSCGANNAVTIDAPLPTGSTKSVPCNTPFNYTNATSQMTLVPHVASSAALGASTEFTVSAVNLSTGTTSASGTAIVSILPASSAAVTTGSAKGSSKGYSRSGSVSNPYGVIDLAVQIISVTPTSAQFKIANIGTKTAAAGWIFTATLPTAGGYAYSSPLQPALMPGGFIINTLTWAAPYNSDGCTAYQYQPYSNYTQGQTYPYTYQNQYPQNCYNNSYGYNQTFSVTVDPYGAMPDVNRANNTASAVI